MRSLTHYIRNRCHGISDKRLLPIKMPLLHVSVLRLCWNGCNAERKLRSRGAGTEVRITRSRVVLYGGGSERRRVLQGVGVAFISVTMLVEDAVSTADGRLAIS